MRSVPPQREDCAVAFINKLIRATPKQGFQHGYSREELADIRDNLIKATAESFRRAERVRLGLAPTPEANVGEVRFNQTRASDISPGADFWTKIKNDEPFTWKELTDAYSIGRRGGRREGRAIRESNAGTVPGYEGARSVWRWNGVLAGENGYFSAAKALVRSNSTSRFVVSFIPENFFVGKSFDSQADLQDSAVLAFHFSSDDLKTWRMDVFDPEPGSEAYRRLDESGHLEHLKESTEDGEHGYVRVKLESRYTTTRLLMQEAVRRLAVLSGEVPDIVVAGRDTGARAGDRQPREYGKDDIEAHFSAPRAPTPSVDPDSIGSRSLGASRNEMQVHALFSTRRESVPLSLEPGNRDVVDSINRRLLGRTRIDMRPTLEDMPDEVKEAVERAGVAPSEFRGVTIGPRMYVAQDAHSSMEEVQRTIFHELYGHYGLRALFGKDIYAKLSNLYMRVGSSGVLVLAEKYGVDVPLYRDVLLKQANEANDTIKQRAGGIVELRRGLLMDELLAHIAESETGKIQQYAKELIGAIRQWLRGHGFATLSEYSDTDLAYLLNRARKAIKTGKLADGVIASFATNHTQPQRENTEEENAPGISEVAKFSRSRQVSDKPPIFYSQLARSFEQAPKRLDNGPATQWKAWLLSNAGKLGVKKDEIQWTGITDWLDGQKGKVSKDDIVEYLRTGGVRVEEVVLGKGSKTVYAEVRRRLKEEIERLADDVSSNYWYDTLHEQAAAEGVELSELNTIEREELLDRAMPREDRINSIRYTSESEMEQQIYAEEEDRASYDDDYDDTKYGKYTPPGGSPGTYRELLLTLPVKPEKFTSSHFPYHKNLIAHLRVDEVEGVNGERLLRVIEAQSDWGQTGRKEGFQNDGIDAKIEALREEARLLSKDREHPSNRMRDEKGWLAIMREIGELDKQRGSIPIAPFVTDTTSWLSLVIKKAISYAAENGMDGVVFATGEQNAALYDLSKHVKHIAWEKNDDGTYNLNAPLPDGSPGVYKEDMTLAEVEDTVGKEIAKKIDGGEGRKDTESGGYRDWRIIEGDGLAVGGVGMKAFYDQIVPQVADKVLKQIGAGAKVQGIGVLPGDGAQPGFLLTGAMKAKAQEGMPLFSKQRKINHPIKKWAEDIQTGVKVKDEAVVVLRHPTRPLQLGRIFRPIGMDASHVKHILNTHPEISPEDIAALPDLIGRPRTIVKNGADGWRVFLDWRDEEDKPLVAILTNYKGGGMKVTGIDTMFGQDESAAFVVRSLAAGNVRYISKWEVARVRGLIDDATQPSEDLQSAHSKRPTQDRSRPTHLNSEHEVTVRSDDGPVKFVLPKALKLQGVAFSKQRIVGDSGRQYTNEQRGLFKNVGREVDHLTTLEKIKKWAGQQWVQGVFDQFAPVKSLDQKAYWLMRLSKGASGAFEAFMHHGNLIAPFSVHESDGPWCRGEASRHLRCPARQRVRHRTAPG